MDTCLACEFDPCRFIGTLKGQDLDVENTVTALEAL